MGSRPRRIILSVVAVVAALMALRLPGALGDAPAPAGTPSRPPNGYWLVGADGGIFSFGGAGYFGSTGDIPLNQPIVDMAASRSGGGYWITASDGGMFAFGDASFHGSTGDIALNQPVVAMAASPTGGGYWLVARDGGIFAFGDAVFHGSTGDVALNQPIVGMAATPTGGGYWLVASDGGIFGFGDAAFHGSTGGTRLNQPIVGMTPTASGNGYWLVARDGGIFTFGDAGFAGSTGGRHLNRPIVGMDAADPGYWLVGSDGGIFTFGGAGYMGSTGDITLTSPIVGMAGSPRRGAPDVAAFYYPWYGVPGLNSRWRHWDSPDPDDNNAPYRPPDDIAASFFPAASPYSSTDPATVDRQFGEMARSGIGTAVVSWWGRGSFEDRNLRGVVLAAARHGVRLALHLEPYSGRSPESALADILYVRNTYGITEVWLYASDGPPPEAWRPLTDAVPDVRLMAHSHSPSNSVRGLFQNYAAVAGFDGVYTYDPAAIDPGSFGTVCRLARARGLLCSPSVGPGYDDRRIMRPSSTVLDREGGARYDEGWRGAFAAGPDIVSITSYNEWHEGTQIEPAAPNCVDTGSFCYDDYEGDYGRTGAAATTAYLDRTAEWAALARR